MEPHLKMANVCLCHGNSQGPPRKQEDTWAPVALLTDTLLCGISILFLTMIASITFFSGSAFTFTYSQ